MNNHGKVRTIHDIALSEQVSQAWLVLALGPRRVGSAPTGKSSEEVHDENEEHESG